ncbi:MAG TPA: hypothetical protein VJT75_00245 [Thermoleophilaceae bacterium]|nr:hypothetical protein [Thermoleophilaceae bacterium]
MRRVSLGVVVALALGAVAAAAPPDPPPPTYVSPPGHSVATFTVAAGGGGRRVLTWAAPDSRQVMRIWVVDRAPGGAFGTPAALSHPSRSAWLPRTAVMQDGTELVGWTESEPNSPWSRVMVATRRPGAARFSRRRLARVREPSWLSLTTGPGGAAAASWVQDTKDHIGRAAVALRTPGGWRKPEVVTDSKRTVSNARVALDGDGNATVVWDRRPPPWKAVVERLHAARERGQAEVRAAFRPRGGRFGRAEVVSNPHHQATDAFLAGNARGDAVVVWRTLPSQRKSVFRLSWAYRRGHGHFGKPHSATRLASLSFPAAAIGPEGAVTIAWGGPGAQAGCDRVFIARRSPGGRLTRPAALSGCQSFGPEVTADRAGNALVLWTPDSLARPDFKTRVEGRFVGADGSIGPARRFSALGNGMEAEERGALAGDGTALVAWHRYAAGHHRLEALDTTVP